MRQFRDLFRYYITFEVEELADGGQTKTYQAVVRSWIPIDVNISVLSFKECERVKGKGITFKGDQFVSFFTTLFVSGALIDSLRLILYMC